MRQNVNWNLELINNKIFSWLLLVTNDTLDSTFFFSTITLSMAATSTQSNDDQVNFLTRVSTLPLISESISLLESNPYSAAAYKQLSSVYTSHSTLITSRLPLQSLNNLGNGALDRLEKQIPNLKEIDSNYLLVSVKATPDHAKQIAKSYTTAVNTVSSPLSFFFLHFSHVIPLFIPPVIIPITDPIPFRSFFWIHSE